MRNWLNLAYSLAWVSVIAECLEKKALTNQQAKMFFNSILKETRKGWSEDIFIEFNKRNFPAKKYNMILNNYS